MRKTILGFFLLLSISSAFAQEGKSSFDFLLLPASTRSAALGGTNISIIENDVSLIYDNPAALGQEMDMSINVNFLSYIADIKMGSATFAKALGERSAWGIGVNYAHYGSLLETTKESIIGDLSANDICGNVFFSRDLTDRIRGGVAAKFVYSNYGEYTAIGLGVDLGLSYYNSDKDFSFGLTGKNLGRQVKAYDEDLYSMPWDIQMGFSKRLSNAPIRFSVTAVNLNNWDFYNREGERESFFSNIGKHLVLGVEALPSDNLWIAIGYNPKRGSDLALDEGNKMAGFSIGAGLKVKAFSFGCAVSQYHPSATSFMFNASVSLAEMKM